MTEKKTFTLDHLRSAKIEEHNVCPVAAMFALLCYQSPIFDENAVRRLKRTYLRKLVGTAVDSAEVHHLRTMYFTHQVATQVRALFDHDDFNIFYIEEGVASGWRFTPQEADKEHRWFTQADPSLVVNANVLQLLTNVLSFEAVGGTSFAGLVNTQWGRYISNQWAYQMKWTLWRLHETLKAHYKSQDVFERKRRELVDHFLRALVNMVEATNEANWTKPAAQAA